ncbi:AAA family ATPase [Serinibacter salmoneus]|uniref:AAA ATPase-like protein n=1 Tax=Serinibacter salmoneus TaxID=556530 RepID=A0A2A9CWE8_9MICO|nr:AAA family ATPase [Serinibacter salmoneus]PFG18466.1 AAA ATPase-like protein [Serinibacter salmoneus]
MVMATPPQSLDDIALALRTMRAEAGDPSFGEIAARIARLRSARPGARFIRRPGKVTVYDAFRDGRRRIDPDLVADIAIVLGFPERERDLRELHRAVLGGLATATARPEFTALNPESLTVIGRRRERDSARDLLMPEEGGPRHLLITGMPGVGKSALARAVAADAALARPRARVLSIGLRTASGDACITAASPSAVLTELTRVIATRPGPGLRAEATDLVLIVEDVTSPENITAFVSGLPPGATVITTSRRRIEPPHGFALLELGPMILQDACDMLATLTDGNYAPTDPARARADLALLAEACGRLPLAITVLAGQIAARPTWYLSDHLRRLEATEAGLVPALEDVYDALGPPARSVLSFLALHPGPLTPAELHIALTDTIGALEVDRSVAVLVRENLLTPRPDDVLELHDIVRATVADRAADDIPSSRRRREIETLATVLTQRFATATERARVRVTVNPTIDSWVPAPDPAEDAVPRGRRASQDWLDAQVPVAITTLQAAADVNAPDAVSRLALSMLHYLRWSSRRLDAYLACSTAMTHGRRELWGYFAMQTAQLLEATDRSVQAEELYAEVAARGGPRERIEAQTNLAVTHLWERDMSEGLDLTRAAIRAIESLGPDHGDASRTEYQSLTISVMRALLVTGRLPEALQAHQRIPVSEDPCDRRMTVIARTRLAEIHLELADADLTNATLDSAATLGDAGYETSDAITQNRHRLRAIQGLDGSDLVATLVQADRGDARSVLGVVTRATAARMAGDHARAVDLAERALGARTATPIGIWRWSAAQLNCALVSRRRAR